MTLATAAGLIDSLTLTLNNPANPTGGIPTTGVVIGGSGLAMNGTTPGQVETLNIVSAGSITTTYNSVTLASSGSSPYITPNIINVSGSQGLTLNTGVLAHSLTVNGSGTGGLVFNSLLGGAQPISVSGTGVNDTISVGGAGQTASILGGVGYDLITITAGMGAVNVVYNAANQSTLDLVGTPGASGASTPNVGTMDLVQGFRTATDKIGLSSVGVIADKASFGSAAAVTAALSLPTFYQDGFSTLRKVAQFDITFGATGTLLVTDVNNNGVYDASDMLIFLAGVANVVATDIN